MSHFNAVANSWDTPEKIELYAHYAKQIKLLAKRNKFDSVLELGCGTGLLSFGFIEEDNHFIGIDTSSGMLEVFNQKFKDFPKAKSYNLNLEENEMPLPNQKFDLIISSMTFHHLKNPLEMLVKFRNILNENGIIAIIDLDQEDGTFHPDPKNMGVHHFGFSDEVTRSWAKGLNFLNQKREIVNIIKKDSRNFPVFLIVFEA